MVLQLQDCYSQEVTGDARVVPLWNVQGQSRAGNAFSLSQASSSDLSTR